MLYPRLSARGKCSRIELEPSNRIASPSLTRFYSNLQRRGKVRINDALKLAKTELHKSKNKQRSPEKAAAASATKPAAAPEDPKAVAKAKKAQEEAERRLAALKLKTEKITSALQWYNKLLDDLNDKAAKTVNVSDSSAFDGGIEEEKKCDDDDLEETAAGRALVAKPKHALSPEQVVKALSSCDSEDALADVETGIDLLQWDSMSEWTIDITESAHKWFKRHIRKDRSVS